MKETLGPEASLAGRTEGGECYDTLAEQMPELDELFNKMSTGEMPNFLEVMSALSSLVAFNTDCDTNPIDRCSPLQKMSQNKCRFCD